MGLNESPGRAGNQGQFMEVKTMCHCVPISVSMSSRRQRVDTFCANWEIKLECADGGDTDTTKKTIDELTRQSQQSASLSEGGPACGKERNGA